MCESTTTTTTTGLVHFFYLLLQTTPSVFLQISGVYRKHSPRTKSCRAGLTVVTRHSRSLTTSDPSKNLRRLGLLEHEFLRRAEEDAPLVRLGIPAPCVLEVEVADEHQRHQGLAFVGLGGEGRKNTRIVRAVGSDECRRVLLAGDRSMGAACCWQVIGR